MTIEITIHAFSVFERRRAMFEGYLSKNLKEGEEVVSIVRPFWLTMGVPVFFASFLLLLDVFLFAWLLQFGRWGFSVFFFLFCFAILWGVRSWIVWSLNAFIVTNQRIIDVDQRGFFHRTVSEAALGNIQDVSFEISGPWQTMFQYGKVIVQTAGAKNNLELEGAHHPEKLQELITKLQHAIAGAQDSDDELRASELLAMVRKIKKGIASGALRGVLDEEREDALEKREDALEDFLEQDGENLKQDDSVNLRRRRPR